MTYPVRTGGHTNTAFALIHAHRWARRHDGPLAALTEERARYCYAGLAHAAAQAHLDAGLGHIADDYMGTHWLASFALLAIDGLDS